MSASDAIRTDAAAMLGDGRARMILGYRRRGEDRVPAFVTDAGGVDALIYDDQCTQNLAAYLRKDEIRPHMPVAVVAAPSAMRSLVLLAAESQITPDDVTVIGVDGETYHGVLDLPAAAALLRERYAGLTYDQADRDRLAELDAMTAEQRAAFWKEQLAKCTRCYACRAACPGCYCTRCIVEKNTPQWISTAALDHGNYAWNVIRAFHLAGRCTACGACQAACPQGIPLMLLNAKAGQIVAEEFDARIGYDTDAEPVIGTWLAEDKEDFIR